MILFLLINLIVVTYVNNKELDYSKISYYNSEDENLKNYEMAKTSLRGLQQFTCVDDVTSCSGNGKCNDQKTDCICDVDFDTFPADSSKQCNYQKKKQLVAFLLEMFLGFGAGHFYTERYSMGGAKLACFLFGVYIICLFPISAKCISDKCDSDWMVLTVACFYYCCVLGLAFWFIYDLVMFGLNKYPDGNGLPLLPWGVETSRG